MNVDKLEMMAQKIAASKNIIKKVEGGNYTKGNIDKSKLSSENTMGLNANLSSEAVPSSSKPILYKNINETKMPKAIIDSMLKKPPVLTEGGSPNGVSLLTDRIKSSMGKSEKPTSKEHINENIEVHKEISGNIDLKLIDHIIEKTVEIVLEKILSKESIDEDLTINIGGRMFGGKLVSLKENKNIKKK